MQVFHNKCAFFLLFQICMGHKCYMGEICDSAASVHDSTINDAILVAIRLQSGYSICPRRFRYTQFKRIGCVEYSGNEAKIMVVVDAKADMIYLSFHYNIIMTAFKTL